MYENEIKQEYALLVSVDTGAFDAEVSINELEELAHTAGAEVVGKVIQKKEAPEKATFVGVGKLAEIIAFCESITPLPLPVVPDVNTSRASASTSMGALL